MITCAFCSIWNSWIFIQCKRKILLLTVYGIWIDKIFEFLPQCELQQKTSYQNETKSKNVNYYFDQAFDLNRVEWIVHWEVSLIVKNCTIKRKRKDILWSTQAQCWSLLSHLNTLMRSAQKKSIQRFRASDYKQIKSIINWREIKGASGNNKNQPNMMKFEIERRCFCYNSISCIFRNEILLFICSLLWHALRCCICKCII